MSVSVSCRTVAAVGDGSAGGGGGGCRDDREVVVGVKMLPERVLTPLSSAEV